MKVLIEELEMYFINHIVSHFPIYRVRKFFYKKAGMTIGDNSRLLPGEYIQNLLSTYYRQYEISHKT